MSTEMSLNGGAPEAHHHQKSFKRKYRKLRHKFKDVMRTSDELFKQEQVAKLAIRRIQEQNNRLLDLMLDINECSQIPRDERHNIGSPSRNSPPRFLSPSRLATITGGDLSILDPYANDNDVDPLELAEEESAAVAPTVTTREENDDSSSSDDEDEDKSLARGGRSEDDDKDDEEAYLEETREFNYRRGIPGTPPRKIREELKIKADRERKEAEVQAKRAAAEAARQQNVVPNLKHEVEDDTSNGLMEQSNGESPAKQLILENYRRGHTPPYLRDCSPFFMTYDEEDAFYYEIDETLNGDLPAFDYPTSPSASKAETDSRNPMSVYNWLRRNEPQVFLQGEEGDKKAGGRGRGGGRKKADKQAAEGSGEEVSPKKSGKGEGNAKAGAKRKRADTVRNGDDGESVTGGRGGRGGGRGRGGRKKAGDSEPAVKRARSDAPEELQPGF